MSNLMSRRAFLKCAGAVTAAAGAASMLSGCDLINGVIDTAFSGVPNTVRVGGVMFSFDYLRLVKNTDDHDREDVEDEEENVLYVLAKVQSARVDGPTELSAANFSMKLDDKDLTVVTGEEMHKAVALSGIGSNGQLYLMDDNGNVDISARLGASGFLVFKPGTEVKEWKKAALTFKCNGESKTVTAVKTSSEPLGEQQEITK